MEHLFDFQVSRKRNLNNWVVNSTTKPTFQSKWVITTQCNVLKITMKGAEE